MSFKGINYLYFLYVDLIYYFTGFLQWRFFSYSFHMKEKERASMFLNKYGNLILWS